VVSHQKLSIHTLSGFCRNYPVRFERLRNLGDLRETKILRDSIRRPIIPETGSIPRGRNGRDETLSVPLLKVA
jgi:hypothetical protein